MFPTADRWGRPFVSGRVHSSPPRATCHVPHVTRHVAQGRRLDSQEVSRYEWTLSGSATRAGCSDGSSRRRRCQPALAAATAAWVCNHRRTCYVQGHAATVGSSTDGATPAPLRRSTFLLPTLRSCLDAGRTRRSGRRARDLVGRNQTVKSLTRVRTRSF